MKQKVLIIGMGVYLDRSQVDELKKQLKPDFPDHEIKVIVGATHIHETVVEREDEDVKPSGAYL